MERNNENRITYAGYAGCSGCNPQFGGSAAILEWVTSRTYAACPRGLASRFAPLSWETRLSGAITNEPPWLGFFQVDCVRSSFDPVAATLPNRQETGNARGENRGRVPHSSLAAWLDSLPKERCGGLADRGDVVINRICQKSRFYGRGSGPTVVVQIGPGSVVSTTSAFRLN
jgi:hypothetical protein